MDPFHFTCPHCGAGLKTRDRLSVGRQVTCPDCRSPLRIIPTKDGLAAEKVEAAPTPQASGPSFRERLAAQLHSNRSLLAATVILGCVLGVTLLIALRPSTPETAAAPDPQPRANARAEARQVKKAQPVPKEVTEVELRLKVIGGALAEQLKAEKAFLAGGSRDAGLPLEDWFGWQAAIVDTVSPPGNIPIVRDRSWRDPLNDAFVRRRIEAFQNPAIPALTGADGYPASHFAGIAGVGEDAASLPTTDPRAGIFGFNRRTKAEDVRDGLANTLLVAGVQDQLGSWASAASTVRSFTQPPFVNGPDGFGTGESGATFVLMADGRVVSLSAKTDPGVLRKLAAMADEAGPTEKPPAGEVAANAPDDQPIEPLHSDEVEIPPELEAPRPPPVKTVAEIEASLQREILAYSFPPRTAIRLSVLREVAELTGVPFVFDAPDLGPAAAKLDQPLGDPRVPVLKDTTVKDILAALLDPLDLSYRVEPGRLRLVRKGQ